MMAEGLVAVFEPLSDPGFVKDGLIRSDKLQYECSSVIIPIVEVE